MRPDATLEAMLRLMMPLAVLALLMMSMVPLAMLMMTMVPFAMLMMTIVIMMVTMVPLAMVMMTMVPLAVLMMTMTKPAVAMMFHCLVHAPALCNLPGLDLREKHTQSDLPVFFHPWTHFLHHWALGLVAHRLDLEDGILRCTLHVLHHAMRAHL